LSIVNYQLSIIHYLRLAPTPSGFLHLGNGVNFVLNRRLADRLNGILLLRIDDLDAERKRPEYMEDVFDTLHWLGIEWDKGPCSVADFEAHWSNRHRMAHYENTLNDLRKSGLLYACAKSRKDLAPFAGQYPVEWRQQGLSLDQPDVAWRVMTPPNFPLPDFVVRRRDGIPAYQIASLTDDLLFDISHIIRGADLESSTLAQQWLADILSRQPDPALDYARFLDIQFVHHGLVFNESGEKLSKSAGAFALRTLRLQGESPEVVFKQADALAAGIFSKDK
jgi:glutamyl-tRNA synthetase